MRLNKIKLAGFKSFVDPTTVSLAGDVVAIVGPNGCGKSNVIDAVRWVMGESSAKHLRGESMADVIFDGSTGRKPVGNASIELIFDNADGAVGGKYAGYNEIAVRRQVNREGQSAYYLNGTRCRRRDITDVFLGTGLGPRSYSIIEQGMISRVIEARPEELRGYLEEAAGISLYKERRRETERRIRDTLENLERLDDVRDEVGRQLEKLKRQADTAERYKTLRAEERQRRAELYVLRLRALDAERVTLRQELAERENAQEAEVARQRELERESETVRARHAEDGDRLNDIQSRYYALGSDIARLDQQISHRRELREKGRREIEQNREAVAELEQTLTQDREKLAELQARLEELEPAREAAAESEAEAREQAETARAALEGWRERWAQFNEQAAEPVRVAQVERARIEQLDRRAEELVRRRERLMEEADRLRPGDTAMELDELREREEAAAEASAASRERLEAVQARLGELRERATDLTDDLEEARGGSHRARARLTSLETLQQAALGENDGAGEWLDAQGLGDAHRLAHVLEVEPGWERAVEAVLADALQAVLVESDLPEVGPPERGAAMLFSTQTQGAVLPLADATPLRDRVSAPWGVDDLFGRVYAAETLTEARRIAAGLGPDESVVTRDGTWLGRRWMRVSAGGEDSETGILAREREIAGLRETVERGEASVAALQDELGGLRTQIGDSEGHRDEAQEALAESERRHTDLRAQVQARRERMEAMRERGEAVAAEIEELAEAAEANAEDIRAARGRLDDALARSEALEGEAERLGSEKLAFQQRLDAAREALQEARTHRHDLALQLESAGTARTSLEEGIERLVRQHERLTAQGEELSAGLAGLDGTDDDLTERREALLEQRLAVEESLNEARARLGEAEQRLRELASARAEVERQIGERRESLESARFREYELKIRAQTQDEQLAELGFERAPVEEGLPGEAAEAEWQRELERLEERIKRLGPINLAAIEEFEALDERKGYLDAQHEDLTEALETLQTAIRRIDRETRNRFKETFDKVNAGLQQLFPRLFGGGQAYLELTGDDLLETGVTIMARPPGKKITNIHLLSGGEKALTAVSLVFAIFELNPAPFCMLDEVDAPLDEANVGRFCEMVREMSRRVQFIVITHNKTTMEAASHLTGVTMNEPGVSRLVAVDVDEAAEMATA